VTGSLGGSLLGHHFDFEPRVREALDLHARYPLHAGMDVSDGLSLDLSRMASESGCGAVIEPELIPISPDAHRQAQQQPDSGTPLEHALSDGEDFELILAVPPEAAEQMLADATIGVPLTRIGRFVAEPGLWRQDANGEHHVLTPRGYQH
jgi:thiamine-monophosphate kinase